jgi:hypothetical protein
MGAGMMCKKNGLDPHYFSDRILVLRMLPRRSNSFLMNEKQVFIASTAALGLNTGYDSDLELNYVFCPGKETATLTSNRFAVFGALDDEVLTAYALKLYSMQVAVNTCRHITRNAASGPCIIICAARLCRHEPVHGALTRIWQSKMPDCMPACRSRRLR